MEWVTDRQPTAADGDAKGLVAMRSAPGVTAASYPVHWSYVALGTPWRHTVNWNPSVPRTLPGVAGQWISGAVKPLESEVDSIGDVQIRMSNGDTMCCDWREITRDRIWRPHTDNDPRPVVLATTPEQ